MVGLTRTIKLESSSKIEFIDITGRVAKIVEESKVKEGIVTVFSRHTTSGVIVNEYEALLLDDTKRLLEKMVPTFSDYKHDDMDSRSNAASDEPSNAPSHIKSLLLGPSQTIPINEGRLLLGTWQSIIFVELDGPRRREVVVQVIGK